MPSFLISRLSSLGDVVCTLPVAATLKQAFPDSHITWTVDKRFAAIVECCPAVDEVHILQSRLPQYERTFDAALEMQGLLKSALAIARAKAPLKLGYHWQREGARLFSSPVTPDPTSFHVVDQYVDVARCAIAQLSGRPSPLPPTSEIHNPKSKIQNPSRQSPVAGRDAFESPSPLCEAEGGGVGEGGSPANERGARTSDLGTKDERRKTKDDSSHKPQATSHIVPPPDSLSKLSEYRGAILLNPGAGWATKRWPPTHFAELIRLLQAEGHRTVLIGGPDTQQAAQEIIDLQPTESLVGKTNLKELIAAISLAKAHVGGDTGSTHIAAALATPAIGLYSITNPRRSCPYGQIENCLYKPEGLSHIEAAEVFRVVAREV